MYNVSDTIVAISSGTTPAIKKIVRMSGDKTFKILSSFFGREIERQKRITRLNTAVEGADAEFSIYSFIAPHSYTGEDTAELHLCACGELTENIFTKLLALGCRTALPGEFTYRAYVNGKIDLSGAEAVAMMIESSNQYQLSAAQKLFGGSIEKKVKKIKNEILELLSLIEAGLDFSSEDIEIISSSKAVQRAEEIRNKLNELLWGSITFEQITCAPSVVIAGAANAGKSSLVNALLGENRSIVSDQSGTTRDVLEHWLKLNKCDCVLFDCAGIIINPGDILQSLANTAAIKAVEDAAIIIFCADISKENYTEDVNVISQIKRMPDICIAAKSDLLDGKQTEDKKIKLKNIFGWNFLPVSSKTNEGIDNLKKIIEEKIIKQTSAASEAGEKTALTQRHSQAVQNAEKNIESAGFEIQNGNDEIAAVSLRAALADLSKLATEHIDEAILDTIFSRFCIGK
ncbi:MAG: tRNA modification GTPase MnmE [Planctomycetes bacterium ADurb.Bin401]|nr:MAG: tRNA modification GTPase MnmE [Planctomycetes bacterium ADurb.Bin401]